MTSWIEPPPKQKGMGCLGKGCLMFVIFIFLLAAAFFIGGYAGVRYVVTSDEPREIPQIETTEADQRIVQERWEDFKESRNLPRSRAQDPPLEGARPGAPSSPIGELPLDINNLTRAAELSGKFCSLGTMCRALGQRAVRRAFSGASERRVRALAAADGIPGPR